MLVTLPLSCADFVEIVTASTFWSPVTSPGLYRDSSTCFSLIISLLLLNGVCVIPTVQVSYVRHFVVIGCHTQEMAI